MVTDACHLEDGMRWPMNGWTKRTSKPYSGSDIRLFMLKLGVKKKIFYELVDKRLSPALAAYQLQGHLD